MKRTAFQVIKFKVPLSADFSKKSGRISRFVFFLETREANGTVNSDHVFDERYSRSDVISGPKRLFEITIFQRF